MRVRGLGLKVEGLGLKVEGVRVEGLGLRIWWLGFKVQGFRVQGLGFGGLVCKGGRDEEEGKQGSFVGNSDRFGRGRGEFCSSDLSALSPKPLNTKPCKPKL